MAKLILNDKSEAFLTVIKVSVDGKVYSVENKGQKIIEINKGEHLLRAYKSILGKGPVKKINITDEVMEIDIKGNKEILKFLFIIIVAMWILIPLSLVIPILLLPTVIILPIIMYLKGQKTGTYILEIKETKTIGKENF